jgi:hypothetical protein
MLGIARGNQQMLSEAILEAAVNSEEAEALGDNGHGMVQVLRFPLKVEFADRDWRAYAILPIQPERLMVLHGTPDYAAA